MSQKKKKSRRTLHIGVLLLGIYLLYLGGGLLFSELGAMIVLGERGGIVIARAVVGAVFTVLGVLAVLDAIRDLRPRKDKDETSPPQVIFTDTAGVCSSILTPERLREQIGMVSGDTGHIALQPVTPIPAAELGELVNLTYAPMEDGRFLVAILCQGNKVHARRKSAEPAEVERTFLGLTAGKAPDFDGWEPLEAAVRQRETPAKRRLLLYRDNGVSDHDFFTERDLDLAITGLTDGTYQRVIVQDGPVFVEAVPKADGDIFLHLQYYHQKTALAWERSGTPNQARFWLLQFYDRSLFGTPPDGWDKADPR